MQRPLWMLSGSWFLSQGRGELVKQGGGAARVGRREGLIAETDALVEGGQLGHRLPQLRPLGEALANSRAVALGGRGWPRRARSRRAARRRRRSDGGGAPERPDGGEVGRSPAAQQDDNGHRRARSAAAREP